MKRVLFSACSLLISVILIAQPCLPEGIIFNAQEALDQFSIDFPDCTIIEGDVLINGSLIDDVSPLNQIEEINGDFRLLDNTQLENFIGLEQLKKIGGDFSVKGSTIKNFQGLENLEIINGNFEVMGNFGDPMNFDGLTSLKEISEDLNILSYAEVGNLYLTDLLGLSALEKIGGDLEISGTEMLKDLKGLEKIDSILGDVSIGYWFEALNIESLEGLNNLLYVGGEMSLEYLNSLKNYDGLEKLEYVGGGLNLEENLNVEDYDGFISLKRVGSLDLINAFKVKDLSGFKNLEIIIDELDIGGLDGLIDLSGMDKLTQIGALFVYECDSVINLNGLEGVTTIASSVSIFVKNNPMLEDISSINNFDPGGIDRFRVLENPKLSLCAIEMVCEVLNILDTNIEIEANGIGCQSIEEVQTACAIIGTAELWNKPVELFPNPVIETIHIHGLDDINQLRIQLFDAYGRLICTSMDIKEGIGVQELMPGIYTIHIYEGNALLYAGKIQKIDF